MRFFRSYQNKSDEELMALVQRKDHRAFSVIYDRYSPKMKAFFFRMLWSKEDMAEDFVHDLFKRIIERPELYNAERLFKPWFFQVAANMCKNAYRKRSFEEEYLSHIEKNGIELSTTDHQIDEEILTNQLMKVLEKISEDKRDLFLLRYQQQLSIGELAEVFDMSEGTIKSRLFYIRKTILFLLSENKTVDQNGK